VEFGSCPNGAAWRGAAAGGEATEGKLGVG